MVWNDLKYYLCHDKKPMNKQELIDGISSFWETRITREYCISKINKVNTVVRKVVAVAGRASGF
jgi:hypothetical protein